MVFAWIETWQGAAAASAGIVAIAAVISFFLWRIKERKLIALVAIPALIGIAAILWFGPWREPETLPPQFEVAVLIDDSPSMATKDRRESRLALVQAFFKNAEPGWLETMLTKRQARVHIYHIGPDGRAQKLGDGDGVIGPIADIKQIKRARKAIARLEPIGGDSRLGAAVKQIIGDFDELAGVILFTDGLSTGSDRLGDAAAFAAEKKIPLSFVAAGDDSTQRFATLKHVHNVETIAPGQLLEFDVAVAGLGPKRLQVPVILKRKGKDGREVEVQRKLVTLDPAGEPVHARLTTSLDKPGRFYYAIEIAPPHELANPWATRRVERTVDAVEFKHAKILVVEGQPRYDFRFLKELLERIVHDKKKGGDALSVEFLLLDADADWHQSDMHAVGHFPATLSDLNEYDMLILGDCDPKHHELRNHLKDIADFVNGSDDQGKQAARPGGSILFLAGAMNNPHRYKGTPLEAILPVEPLDAEPPADKLFANNLNLKLTPAGEAHPIFQFRVDRRENIAIWNRLAPMHWYATGYRARQGADILAVHPENRHPLVVHQKAGSGRALFFGFDESWRWRLREDQPKFEQFWINTLRFLAGRGFERTILRLDSEAPYRVGDRITIKVQSDNMQMALAKDAQVAATIDEGKDKAALKDAVVIPLKQNAGQWHAGFTPAQPGKYRFTLTHPVLREAPDAEKPSALAVVLPQPREADAARIDYQSMLQAAHGTTGKLFSHQDGAWSAEKMPLKTR